MADLAANNELECRKTLHWAGQDAEAGSWFVTVPGFCGTLETATTGSMTTLLLRRLLSSTTAVVDAMLMVMNIAIAHG